MVLAMELLALSFLYQGGQLQKSVNTKSGGKLQTVGKQSTKLGRPLEKPDPLIVNEIIDWIAHGNTLRSYCRLKNKPNWRTIYNWLEKDDGDFIARFAHARDMGADAIAEECLEIIDAPPPLCGSEGNTRLDPAAVQMQKNRVEARLKLLAKWNPKKYGEKVGVEAEGSISLNISTGVPQT